MPNISYNNFSTSHIVANARKLLQENNVKDYNISAVRLAEYCLKEPLYLATTFSLDQLSKYNELLNKRILGIPIQHLVGRAYFRYLELESNSDVFIPRPETELLVDEVISYFNKLDKNIDFKVVDLCTGSANIAISIASEINNSIVYGVEISKKAFEVALRNNEKYGSKVRLILGDATTQNWLKELYDDCVGKILFDCIVSNPPYIPNDRKFFDEVRFDPHIALYGGENNGLYIPKKIVDVAKDNLKNGGLFIIEHDDTHQEELHDYILYKGFSKVDSLMDLNGYPRFIKSIL